MFSHVIFKRIFHLWKIGKWESNVGTSALIRPRVLVQEMHPTVLPWKAPRNAMIESFFPSPIFSFELVHSSSVTLSVPRSRFINALKTVLNAFSFEHEPHIIVVTPSIPGGAHRKSVF